MLKTLKMVLGFFFKPFPYTDPTAIYLNQKYRAIANKHAEMRKWLTENCCYLMAARLGVRLETVVDSIVCADGVLIYPLGHFKSYSLEKVYQLLGEGIENESLFFEKLERYEKASEARYMERLKERTEENRRGTRPPHLGRNY